MGCGDSKDTKQPGALNEEFRYKGDKIPEWKEGTNSALSRNLTQDVWDKLKNV